jgi:hypothetical protein
LGFELYVSGGVARAEGTHEYRPMGTAVISVTDLFRARDFNARRPGTKDRTSDFAGFFASLVDLNDYLRRLRGAALVD